VRERIKYFVATHKKLVYIGLPVAIIVLFGVIVGLIRYLGPTSDPVVVTNPEEKDVEQPVLVPSLLNGVMVDPDVANRRTVAVMIENSTDARPQVGLTNADVVYEAVAEGGITRFMGIFQQTYPKKAGPIRSARSNYIDYLSEYDSVYVHAGGSPTALNRIGSYGIKDYPHSNDGTFWREPMAGVAIEHTLFANISQIFKNATTTKKWSKTHNFKSWLFKDPATDIELGSTLTINFSSPAFAVRWDFDKKTNTYKRVMAGSAHKDRLSGKQITAKTVVVMSVNRSANVPYPGGKQSEWTHDTIGSGNASVFIDGKRIRGTWKKPSRKERTRFYDESGTEIALNRGHIWIEVVPQTGSFKFTAEKPPTTTTTEG
jgi:hypothetical protein